MGIFFNYSAISGQVANVKPENSTSCPNGQFAINESSNGSFSCSTALTTQTAQLVNVPCTYFLTSISGLISAFLCNGNILTYTSAINGNASGVLNAVISSSQCSTGCDIFISSGKFPINNTITGSSNYITINGLGTTSKITATSLFNQNLFVISGQNWLIENLGFNTTGITRGLSKGCLVFTGNNDTSLNNYFLNCDHPAINIQGSNDFAYNNLIVNTTDDGIIVQGGSHININTNVIRKTNVHNCISLVTTQQDLITNNICVDSAAYGIALENLGAGVNNGIIVTGNSIINSKNVGIRNYPQFSGVDSATNYTFVNNYITLTNTTGDAIDLESGKNGIICSNTVEGGSVGVFVNSATLRNTKVCNNDFIGQKNYGVDILANAKNIQVLGNSFQNDTFTTGGGVLGLSLLDNTFSLNNHSTIITINVDTSQQSKIIGNSIFGTGVGTASSAGVSASGSKNDQINNNLINGTITSCISINVNSVNDSINGNSCIGTMTNGIVESTGSNYNTIQFNYVGISVTTPYNHAGRSGNQTVVVNNIRINSQGKKTNFILSGGTANGDGNYISPIGTTATLVASTAYTISNSPALILVQAIGLSTISINGGASITPTIGETYYLYPGQTINFGAFGVTPPTLQVIFS